MSSRNSKADRPDTKAAKVGLCNKRKLTASQVAAKLMSDSDSELRDDTGDDSDFSADVETETDDSCDSGSDDVQNTPDTRTNQMCTGSTEGDFCWTSDVNAPDVDFAEDHGFRNLPDTLTVDSDAVDFLELFLDNDLVQLMVDGTNKRACQTKASKPCDYYAKSWIDVTVPEMRAFIGIRLSMEHIVVKPRYADYFSKGTSCPLTATPGYRTIFTRDRFLAIWKFWHIVDEQDNSIDKTDKIYKLRPALEHILRKFRHYYYPGQTLSLDEGMVPFKGRLAIKQYCKDKPTKWGIKVFLLTDSTNGYLYSAEVYTGKVDGNFVDGLGATGSIVVRLVAGLEHKNHVVFMDRFYTSPILYSYLCVHGIHACGTVQTNRKFFPKQLILPKKELQRGQHKYLCSDNISAVVWYDRRPIYFLSTYHDPTVTSSVNRKNKDGSIANVTCPALVNDYNTHMGGVDKNDQMAKLFRPRKHYRWPRRLLMKIIMWACYNAYIAHGHLVPHKRSGRRLYTFADFLQDCVNGLIGDFQSSAVKRRRTGSAHLERLCNVGVHFPERAPDATGNNRCRVCREKHNRFHLAHPDVPDKDNPYPLTKTRMWCTECKEYLCVREGYTCFTDYHTKKQYWR